MILTGDIHVSFILVWRGVLDQGVLLLTDQALLDCLVLPQVNTGQFLFVGGVRLVVIWCDTLPLSDHNLVDVRNAFGF